MTCAECRDLLLDLAYGELSAERAAEVEAHLSQCAECGEERARLDRTRRLVAPLRAVEDPSPSFDEPILRAARAEATMQSDGTPGEVVEVSASVKPLGLQPARVDPHGEVNVARRAPTRRWLRRVAVAGSVAAAASVALVVGVSLQHRPAPSSEEVPEIRVQAPVVPSAVDEARRNAAPPPAPVDTGARAKSEPASRSGAEAAAPVERAPVGAAPHASPLSATNEEPPKAQPKALKKEKLAQTAESQRAAPIAQKPGAAEQRSRTAPADLDRAQASRDVGVAAGAESKAAPERARAPAALSAAPPDAGAMETSAESSRHAGQYEAAAQLYRNAADARRSSGDTTRAAWNLAHAVECLAAASRLDEARRVRDDLLREFPQEEGPRHAADRALGYPQR